MASKIEISGNEFLEQAKSTAHDFMIEAVHNVNEIMGSGASEKFPQIVAAMIQAAATDVHGAIIAQQVRAGLDAIASSVDDMNETMRHIPAIDGGDLVSAISSFGETLAKSVQQIAEMIDLKGK
jgi:phage terminase large subunit